MVIPESATANPVDAGEPVEEINKETLGDEAINASRLPEGGSDKGKGKKSKNRSVKYVYPECGATIRRTKEVNVVWRGLRCTLRVGMVAPTRKTGG